MSTSLETRITVTGEELAAARIAAGRAAFMLEMTEPNPFVDSGIVSDRVETPDEYNDRMGSLLDRHAELRQDFVVPAGEIALLHTTAS
jgi:hypothetical protein